MDKTLNEVAAELGILPGTLRHQILNGKLRAKKRGPIWLVTPAELARYRRDSHGRRGRTPKVAA